MIPPRALAVQRYLGGSPATSSIAVVGQGGAALGAAPALAAPKPEYVAVNSYIPARIDATIGFVPSHGMAPDRVRRVRSGGRTFHFLYQNSAVVWPRTSMILSTLAGRYASTVAGGFVDAPLTAKQRKRLVVRLDLGRDADVLAVAKDHPACGAGLTTAQARGIARGTITRWSAVVAGAPGAIAVRVEAPMPGAKVPRWGVRDAREYAKGTKGAPDGGLGAAGQGDQTVAALTSWSRARAYASTVCAVPIDGVAPTDASVFARSYPAAFPIGYVVPRRPFRATRHSRAVMRGFIDWLGGADAAKLLRARGMMLVADGPPAPPPPPAEVPPPDPIPVEAPPPEAVELPAPAG
jgi:hypothetical protein